MKQEEKKFNPTQEEVREIVNRPSYQRWKAEAECSKDWRYWCFRTLTDEGIPDIFVLYAYIYLDYDTEYGVRPFERKIEFTLWMINTYTCSTMMSATLLMGWYCREHHDLVLEILEGKFRDTNVYSPVSRVLADCKALQVKGEEPHLPPLTFVRDIEKIIDALVERGICKREGENVVFNWSATYYAFLVRRLTDEYWGKKGNGKQTQCKWREIDAYFSHPTFKLETAKTRADESREESKEKDIKHCIAMVKRNNLLQG